MPSLKLKTIALGLTTSIAGLLSLVNVACATTTPTVVSQTKINSGYAADMVIKNNLAYVANGYYGELAVLDITNPQAPVVTQSIKTSTIGSHNARGVDVYQHYAFVTVSEEGMYVIDLTTNKVATFISTDSSYLHYIRIQDHYAYVSDNYQLLVFDIANPLQPVQVGRVMNILNNGLYASITDLFISGQYGYITFDESSYSTGNEGFAIIDLRNPAQPTSIFNTLTPTIAATGIATSNQYAYVVGYNGLNVYDISQPSSAKLVGSNMAVVGRDITIYDQLAYTVDETGNTVNITDPTHPVIEQTFKMGTSPSELVVDPNFFYIADSQTGLIVMQFTQAIDRANVSTTNTANDVAVLDNYAYIANNSSGLAVVDITNTTAPALIATVPTHGKAQSVAISNQVVYVVDYLDKIVPLPNSPYNSMYFGTLSAFDISNRTAPKALYQIPFSGRPLDVTIVGTTAYVAVLDTSLTNQGEILVMNLTRKNISSHIHTKDRPYHLTVRAGNMYIADGTAGLSILNLQSGKIVGNVLLADYAESVALVNQLAYVVTYKNGMYVVDVSDPTHPYIVNTLPEVTPAVDIVLEGNRAYIASVSTGLQVLDITNSMLPKKINTISTYKSANELAMKDNVVIVADSSAGLTTVNYPR